ncbi:chromosomal replication initiator protein DnaA [Marivibrio halodurans]|uniref:Chromosomal replication initiator protein DnaA n=1 Tax=Marivibrio halodurans TaxID=2039722 RepID=A0A8J7S1A6_9PROT|nr:chromosomal replication initiator protein DnaA [Marivibrio halodurans]
MASGLEGNGTDRSGSPGAGTGTRATAGTPDGRASAQWARIRARLRSEFGETAFKNWLKPLILDGIEGGTVRLTAPNRFMRNWIESQYGERLMRMWSGENGTVREVVIHHAPQGGARHSAAGGDLEALDGEEEAGHAAGATRVETAPQNDLCAPLNGQFTFESFIVGKPNELAFAAARRVAEAASVPFNPLFLFGGVGLGKTHLMHAIAQHIRLHSPQKRVLYLSAEKFMYQFIRALRYRDTMAFKEQFRSVDVLMIDDVQFIAGKENTQEEFFHTFNTLVDQNRQVVISADKSPAELDGIEDRMKSRLGWGLVAEIHSTTYELRLGILQSKAEQLGIAVPQKVLEFLAHKITSNVRELEGALNRLVAYANLIGRQITLETAQDVLHDLLRANDRRITIEEIQKRVAEHYNIKLAEMHSARRSRAIARPRQVAMYLAKQLTSRSLPEIGRKFGGRDHTTVMHAVKKIEELRASDAGFAEDVELLKRMLEA